jgi:hypothetical protein
MLGFAPISEVPLSTLREGEEEATESPFLQLLNDPNARTVFLVELFPFRIAS